VPDRAALLLLPGLLCDARLWRDQIAGLGDVADAQVADLTRDDAIADMARAPSRLARGRLSASARCNATTPRPEEERHVER
jgi:hypothetical protein